MNATAPIYNEEAFFFPIGGERLFGFMHLPSGAPRGGLVLCHAFAEEKLWSHRVYVTFARQAAAAGYAVLRFDVRGEGDSDRDFEAATIETRIEDTVRAAQVLRERVPQLQSVTMVGHRLGGSIAAAAAMRAGDMIDALAIWDPVLDGGEYFSQLLRSNLTTQMATEGKVIRTRDVLIKGLLAGEAVIVDGYGLTPELYHGMTALQLATLSGAFNRPALILEILKGEQTAVSAPLLQLGAGSSQVTCELVTEQPFWRETRQFHQNAPQFSAATLRWLQQR